MGLLDRLIHGGDPTRDWPENGAPPPAVSRITMAPEVPRFGTPLEDARQLGRPDQFRWHSRKHGNCELLYARKGFALEYEDGRLVGLTYHLSPHSCAHPLLQRATPRTPAGELLSSDLDLKRVLALFGDPDEPDEQTLVYTHDRTTSVLTFSEDGKLERWEVFMNT